MALGLAATPCKAQEASTGPRGYSTLTSAAGNVALGAVTAALGQAIRRKPVTRASLQGAFGGALVFAGKSLIAQNHQATNLLARQVAAIGSSGVRNAAAGRGFADELALPYGPFRLHVLTTRRPKVRLKLDLAMTMVTIRAAFDREVAFDPARSFASGVAVFETDSTLPGRTTGGSYTGGVVRFRVKTPLVVLDANAVRELVGHEFVHAVQSDFVFNAWVGPIEEKLLAPTDAGRRINRYVDLGLNVPLWSVLNSLVPYRERPWEREAVALAKR